MTTALDDPKQRTLVPVACLTLQGVIDGIHLSVRQWVPQFHEWATGPALCGKSAEQGPLPDGTPITCQGCEGYRDSYERALDGRPSAAQEELATLRAENQRLRDQLAALPVIPELPTEHDGHPIEWRPWEPAPVILCHGDDFNPCPQCNHPGPSALAFGIAGPGRPVIRFNAHRCPACQETRVYYRDYSDRYRIGAKLLEIAYHPPRTIPAVTP